MPEEIDWQARAVAAEAERDALARTVAGLREALNFSLVEMVYSDEASRLQIAIEKCKAALALPLPESAEIAAAERAFCDVALAFAGAKATIEPQAVDYKKTLAALKAARSAA